MLSQFASLNILIVIINNSILALTKNRNYLTKVQQNNTSRDQLLLNDDGFDENWLHCYAQLNTSQVRSVVFLLILILK